MHDDAEPGFDKRVGANIRDLRNKKGWSQRQLAESLQGDLRLDPSAITRIERGERSIKLREAAAIADALEVALYQIVTHFDNPHDEELRQLTNSAHWEIRLAQEAFHRMATVYLLAAGTISKHGNVMTDFSDPRQYLAEEARRAAERPPAARLRATANEHLDQIEEIMRAATSNLIVRSEADDSDA
ncbi:helix-turn-helix domain-containing protein [Mycolicibacterium farcinogenes]|uniref:Helix-turn-helix domain-containing protein n=1 Tax=Mycolicibacterium farcinogenes TaxID=1802 RepID=A0ACD1FJ47_MYCFR|nr:helix-turn-helix transcriptional regulator [Mycolicibacterium farcinogenes]QZH66937.1 helix-turn-helix domain-containing protein [Mycolicibacterium farcinogenes]